MKLNANQLGKQLQGSLAAVYAVSGDEPLLCQEASDAIRGAARAQGFDEREVFDVDAGFDWGRLYEAGASLSLFAQKRILELQIMLIKKKGLKKNIKDKKKDILVK